jgi:GWxTD domain-containing protein
MRTLYFLLIICSSLATAQVNNEFSRSAPSPLNPLSFEIIPYLSDDTASIELAVIYRVNPVFLIFAKANGSQQDTYEAKGEIVMEIFDCKDAAVAREIRSLRIERNSLPSENSPVPDFIQGAFSLKLNKGSYKAVIEIKDNESGRSFIIRDIKIDAQHYSSSGLNISPVVFIESTTFDTSVSEQKPFYPLNFGGNVEIGQSGRCFFQAYSPDTISKVHVAWKVVSKEEIDQDDPIKLSGEKSLQLTGRPVISNHPKQISYSIKNDSKRSHLIFVSIPIERLETGNYHMDMTVTQDTLKTSKEVTFKVIWPLKPRSLENFNVAVDALKHIATEEEISQIKASDSQKALKAFRDFWRKQNPDTTNAFNPAMAEYYRRVDETIKRFSLANTSDGYRTDRGRIYILFGSPTFTNRLLRPNTAPTELWTYEKLKQRFTFVDQNKSGNYILVKTEKY